MYDKRLLIKLVDWCGRLRDPRKCIRISFMRCVFKELIQRPAGSVGQLSILGRRAGLGAEINSTQLYI